jgi:hypothetical protein
VERKWQQIEIAKKEKKKNGRNQTLNLNSS